MAILSKGTTFSTGGQVTAATLNALVDSATFDDPADESTIEKNTSSGKLQVKDAGIGSSQLATDAVTTAKILDANVTAAKLATGSVTNANVAASVITGQTELTAAPANTDELLISDAGTLKRIDVSDLFKHAALPQAYGIADFASGSTTLTGAYNVTSIADGADQKTITLAITMASATDYVVLVTEEGTSQASSAAVVEIDSATQFTIHRSETSGRRVHFAVFGTRA